MRDFGAGSEEAHRLHETQVLPPFAEGQAGFLLEEAFDGSSAGTAGPADARDAATAAGVGDERIGDTQRSRVGRVRQLQGDHLNRPELVDDDLDQVAVRPDGLAQRVAGTGVEDQFLQQLRDIDHTTVAGKGSREAGPEVKRPHGHCAGHGDGVGDGLGYPDGAVRWDNPGATGGADGHDATRRVHQLIAIVEVRGDAMPCGIVAGERDDGGAAIREAIEFWRVS